jgi:hypothetical protein
LGAGFACRRVPFLASPRKGTKRRRLLAGGASAKARVVAERDDAQKAPTGLTAIRVLFAPAWRTTSRLRRAGLRSIEIEMAV